MKLNLCIFIFIFINSLRSQNDLVNISKTSSDSIKNCLTTCQWCIKNTYKIQPCPCDGGYGPWLWIDRVRDGIGEVDYICIPVENIMETGLAYDISLKIKVGETYRIDEYYKNHFGICIVQDLPKKYSGLWNNQFYNLPNLNTKEENIVNISVRSQCKPKYIVIGVFNNDGEPKEYCDICWYKYYLVDYKIKKSEKLASDCIYLCDIDTNIEKEHKKTDSTNEVTFHYELNSSSLDSIYLEKLRKFCLKNKNSKSGYLVEAFTDKSGKNNLILGQQRADKVVYQMNLNGVDKSFIKIINHSDSLSKHWNEITERKVVVKLNEKEKSNIIYEQALESQNTGDFSKTAVLLTKWLKYAKPESSIYSIFDCRLQNFYSSKIGKLYLKKFKNLAYGDNDLSFSLDSIWCEDQRDRTLSRHIQSLYTSNDVCFDLYENVQESNELFVNSFIDLNGFPDQNTVGRRSVEALLYVIIHSKNIAFQTEYIDKIYTECDLGKIPWRYYAILYDKISLKERGVQRYGTQIQLDSEGHVQGYYPFEDSTIINELRLQVKLPPLVD